MDDSKIVELFWSRNEKAIDEVSAKYSRYCLIILLSVLLLGHSVIINWQKLRSN